MTDDARESVTSLVSPAMSPITPPSPCSHSALPMRLMGFPSSLPLIPASQCSSGHDEQVILLATCPALLLSPCSHPALPPETQHCQGHGGQVIPIFVIATLPEGPYLPRDLQAETNWLAPSQALFGFGFVLATTPMGRCVMIRGEGWFPSGLLIGFANLGKIVSSHPSLRHPTQEHWMRITVACTTSHQFRPLRDFFCSPERDFSFLPLSSHECPLLLGQHDQALRFHRCAATTAQRCAC